jgi:uncharacterized membrane protein
LRYNRVSKQTGDTFRNVRYTHVRSRFAARAGGLAPYVVLGLMVLGAALRMLALDSKGLWLDEAFSVWLGNQSLGELFGWLVRVDQHPPLYYTLLHFWIGLFGDSAFAVRMLSALVGTLTIPVIYLLGKRLLGVSGGLLAAAVLTVSPFHVRFAQETRMYTLLTLNAALALLCLAILLTDPRATLDPLGAQLGRYWRTRRAAARLPLSGARTDLAWLGLIVFTAATVLSHNTAILFPVATNLFVLGFIFWRRRFPPSPVDGAGFQPVPDDLDDTYLRPPSLRNWLLAQAGTFLLWSPWLVAFVIQATGVYQEFWIGKPTLETVAATIGVFFSAHLPLRVAFVAPVTLIFAALLVLGALHLRRAPATLAFLVVLIATPFVGELLVSLQRPIFYDRTLIWTTIPIFLLLAAGLLRLRHAPYVLATLGVIVAINAVSLREYYAHFEKEQWREAAAYVAENVHDDDLLIFNATWVQIPFDYYFDDADRPVEERGAPVDLFDRGILEPKMARSDLPRLRALVRGRDRVWLIYSHNWYTDPQNLLPGALSEELDLLQQRSFVGLDVRLYGASD